MRLPLAFLLAARFRKPLPICLGILIATLINHADAAALGMLIANLPAVLLGDRIAHKIPLRLVHGLAALIIAILGVASLLGAGADLGF